MFNPDRIPTFVPLTLALLSLGLFPLGISVMEETQAWPPALGVALPAMGVGAIALALGCRMLKTRPSGKRYGFGVAAGYAGGFAIIFWSVMVPMLLLIAYPARQLDSVDPVLDQSRKQMVILVRHIKTFHKDHDRLPVKLEELVEKGYIQPHLMYDPRQQRRDAPSYRLMVRELPSPEDWGHIPILEGRIPDAEGHRLCAFADETTGSLPPFSSP
jgi:hypothetical protein